MTGNQRKVHRIPISRQLAVATRKIHILERAIQDANALLVEKSETIKRLLERLEHHEPVAYSEDEQVIVPCFVCQVPILVWWSPGRGCCRGEYVLVADSVAHPKCFDRWCEEVTIVVARQAGEAAQVAATQPRLIWESEPELYASPPPH